MSTVSADGLSPNVLVVDGDAAFRAILRGQLAGMGCLVFEAASGAEARIVLGQQEVDVTIVDVVLPDGPGYELCDDMARLAPHGAVIVMASDHSLENAIAALRRGAVDFLLRPFSVDALRTALQALEAWRGDSRPPAVESPGDWRALYAPGFIGQDPRVLHTLHVVQRIADTDCTVLITGESGTGKEIIARALHAASPRAARPFLVVNCAAIPESLFESELFGHVRGAFTGAVTAHQGAFAAAHEGTIFLDEVGELPPFLQPKLLRVLQEKEVTPIGTSQSLAVNVRVVAATNRDLDAMVLAGKFREDLLYRLNGMPVELPPLRARPGDVPELAKHFLERGARLAGVLPKRLSAGVLALMQAHDWPGNVRELENVVDRMSILCAGEVIEESDLPVEMRVGPDLFDTSHLEAPELPAGGIDLRTAVREAEERLIHTALTACDGNRNRAAALLGLNRTTLSEKLKRRG
ncbi:MAG: sigma-54-dependent Fis family transcriptional regulator [Myxococcales bacterium]|nr:sigma-54-dependent Fis family transcriptional regulator [Myxococcales bacterium]